MENTEINVDQIVDFYNTLSASCETARDNPTLVDYAAITLSVKDMDKLLFSALATAYIDSVEIALGKDEMKRVMAARWRFYESFKSIEQSAYNDVDLLPSQVMDA